MLTSTVLTGDNPTPIRQVHLSWFHQRLQDACDIGGRLVCLVNHQDVAVLDGPHQGWVLVDDHPVLHCGLQGQRLDSRVSAAGTTRDAPNINGAILSILQLLQ